MGLTISYFPDSSDVGSTTLVVAGSIDLSVTQLFVEAGMAVLCSEERRLVLDLSAVDFMDAAGVAALVGLSGAAQRWAKSFEISAMSHRVRRVLDLVDLAERWSVPAPGRGRPLSVVRPVSSIDGPEPVAT